MLRLRIALAPLLCCLAAIALAGCSGLRVVDARVQSYSTLSALPTPPSYRIERLPSQQNPQFDAIAALADQALARVGLHADAAAPRLLVQIGLQAGSVPRAGGWPPYPPFGTQVFYGPPPWSGHWVWGWGGWGWNDCNPWYTRSLWCMGPPAPLHRRAVSLLLRDATTQAIVYESSAVHEDVWVRDPAVYGLLFDAALNGFPAPPAGARALRLALPATPPAR